MAYQPDDDLPEPPRLRLLRWLVTGLTAVLILAVITVVALLVIRLTQTPQAVRLELPASVTLPEGETAEAATLGRGWVLVVTRDAEGAQRARLFDAGTGVQRQVMEID